MPRRIEPAVPRFSHRDSREPSHPRRSPADGEAAAAARAAGWGATIITAPAPPAAAAPPPAGAAAYTLPPDLVGNPWSRYIAHSFKCFKESTELSVDDELYFAFLATDGRSVPQWLSLTIENVDAGEFHYFPASGVLRNRCTRAGHLAIAVDVWEEDSGDQRDDIRRLMNQAAQSMIASGRTRPRRTS
ncbi:hypothetical protein [Streptomyces tsukubensis]|uniref:hypothetical protein n=1 Tax=Streptomyces tsukubensis TaxID=83656 RepID=UPI00344FCB26